jgi:hypothetical protein
MLAVFMMINVTEEAEAVLLRIAPAVVEHVEGEDKPTFLFSHKNAPFSL